jgi:hypothetical protein
MPRPLLQFLLLALAAAAPLPGRAATPAGSGLVVAVRPTRVADLVLLDAGFDAGLRQGMVCRVTRGSREIAEILLVALRPNHSAALIVNVAPRQSILHGDSARIKVLKS